MIDKRYFGKRIAQYRKRRNLSQADLAEYLGVTSQAVSKWECGSALPDVELLLELSRLYGATINALLCGDDLLSRIADRSFTMRDIACFVDEAERLYNRNWAKEIVSGQWIRRNWEAQKKHITPVYEDVAKRINAHGGTILEIGAGPGGGFMPSILFEKPDANIIISDLSPTVVREWKKLLDGELHSPNIFYAALNNCDLPFQNDSIDVVSDGGGIGNTEGERQKALNGIYRILKPGGLFVTSTGFVTKETLSALPENVQLQLLEKRPDIFQDLYEETVIAGFTKIDSMISGCWYTENDDSTIADLARSLGINLKFTSYVRYCTK